MRHSEGRLLLAAVLWRSWATMHLHTFPSSPLKLPFPPSCSLSAQDKSASGSSNLAPCTGPGTNFHTGSRAAEALNLLALSLALALNATSPGARGHIHTHSYKRAHACALPFHCRHNSQLWLCASLMALPMSERHVNQRKEAASPTCI